MTAVMKLLKSLRAGAAFEDRLRPQLSRLHRLAWRLTGSEAEADDLLQEALMRAWARRIEFHDLDSPGPWLARVLYHTWMDLQRERGLPASEASFENSSPIPATSFVNDDERLLAVEPAVLERALRDLPPVQRAVLLMHDGEGYSLEHTADTIEAPTEVVKSHLYHAREVLRDRLRDGSISTRAPTRTPERDLT